MPANMVDNPGFSPRELQFHNGVSDARPDPDPEPPAPKKVSRLAFEVDEYPPLHIGLFYAFQMVVSNLPGNVAAVFLIHSTICGGKDYEFLAQMLASSIVMTGVATFLQVFLGSRLPVSQGSAFSFFPPIIALMSTEQWKCQFIDNTNGTSLLNATEYDKPWRHPIRYVSGGMIFASLIQVFLGVTGLVGFLTTFIGPVTIAPCVMLIGLSLWGFISGASQHQWGISILTAFLMMLFSVILGKVKVPTPTWSRDRGFHIRRYPLIRMFSNILAMAICWLLCYILTVTGRFTDNEDQIGYLARTDAKLDAITKMDWFYFPYPGQFGAPLVGGAGIFVGMLAATLSSVIESIGDYYATARICQLPPPPKHAMNRGIAMEGFASVIAGFVGTCHGTTSLSQMVGFIGQTGVASRLTWIFMAGMLFLVGIFGKLTGALATIPDPIIGGVSLLSLGLVVSVGISQLHSVDLEATRNQMALGLALLLGIMIPNWLQANPGALKTGNEDLDQVLIVFLSTGMFVGGVVGCILDNILPGTRKERGMDLTVAAEEFTPEDYVRAKGIYDLPFSSCLNGFRLFSWCPCLPCYIDRCEGMTCCCKKKKNREEEGTVGYHGQTEMTKVDYPIVDKAPNGRAENEIKTISYM